MVAPQNNKKDAQAVGIDREMVELADNAVSALAYRVGNNGVAFNYVFARLIELNVLNHNRIDAAMILVRQLKEIERARQEKVAAEEEEKRKVQSIIDSVFPNLYNNRNARIEEYNKYLASVSNEELAWFIGELKSHPQHWKSMFRGGDIIGVTAVLESELTKRQNGNAEKPFETAVSRIRELKTDLKNIQVKVEAAISGKKSENNYAR